MPSRRQTHLVIIGVFFIFLTFKTQEEEQIKEQNNILSTQIWSESQHTDRLILFLGKISV